MTSGRLRGGKAASGHLPPTGRQRASEIAKKLWIRDKSNLNNSLQIGSKPSILPESQRVWRPSWRPQQSYREGRETCGEHGIQSA